MRARTNDKALAIIAQRSRYKASARFECKQQELSSISVSKASEHETGANYAMDARRARKALQTVNYKRKVRATGSKYKPNVKSFKRLKEGDTRISTHGRDDRDVNSYFRSKHGDNMPRGNK